MIFDRIPKPVFPPTVDHLIGKNKTIDIRFTQKIIINFVTRKMYVQKKIFIFVVIKLRSRAQNKKVSVIET